MQHTTMFAHDDKTIYYPTAPGRVFMITFTSLSDCDGSDEDYSDSTSTGDVGDLLPIAVSASLKSTDKVPSRWPTTTRGINDEGEEGIVEMSPEEVAEDFADALESWADWCDRDSVRLDSLDEIMTAVRAA